MNDPPKDFKPGPVGEARLDGTATRRTLDGLRRAVRGAGTNSPEEANASSSLTANETAPSGMGAVTN